MTETAQARPASANAGHNSRKYQLNSRSTLLAQVMAANALAIVSLVFLTVLALNFDFNVEGRRAELIVLMFAIVFSLSLNIVILRKQFAPLDSLIQTMDEIDLTKPGARADEITSATADIADLVSAFNTMLQRLETERRKNARAAVNAQEKERARVARDLHDEVNQALTAILLRLEATVDIAPDELTDELIETKRLAAQAMEELLEVSRRLRPTALDLGLRNALEAHVKEFGSRTGIEIKFVYEGSGRRLDSEEELAIYRIAQESLSNIAQHADANVVTVKLSMNRRMRLEISDNGSGFDRDDPTNRYGIRGMHERALLVGGRLDVTSTVGEGTLVVLEIR